MKALPPHCFAETPTFFVIFMVYRFVQKIRHQTYKAILTYIGVYINYLCCYYNHFMLILCEQMQGNISKGFEMALTADNVNAPFSDGSN